MPKGELYIKTSRMSASTDKTGIVDDDKSPFCGYCDAFVRYGLSLGDGAIDKLMTESPAKSPKGTSLATSDGVSYIADTVGVCDERQLSLEVNLVAHYRLDYLKKYRRLCHEVLCKEKGYVVLFRTRHEPPVRYRLIYQTMEQLRQWMSGGIGLMTLVFTEPHPELQWLPQPTGSVVKVVDKYSDLPSTGYNTGDLAIITSGEGWQYDASMLAARTRVGWGAGIQAEVGSTWNHGEEGFGYVWQYTAKGWKRVMKSEYM